MVESVSQIGEIGETAEIREQPDTSIVPKTEVEQKTIPCLGVMDFGPLPKKRRKSIREFFRR